MKNCHISSIPANLFRNQKKLRRLYLNHNLLPNVTSGTFAGLDSLEWLFLDFNKIQTFELDDLKHLNSLQLLNLSYNFLSFTDDQRFPNLPNIYELWVHFIL